MGLAQVLDQGLAGLVLQLLEAGSADLDWQALGLGFQLASAVSQNAEHDFAHRVQYLSVFLIPSLAGCGPGAGATGYGQPPLQAPLAGSQGTSWQPRAGSRTGRR